MPDVMMSLGSYQFSIDTAAYENLRRVTEYRWASMLRIGVPPSQQWIGPGLDEIELHGRIFPWYKGGLGQVDTMRGLAGNGAPLTLVTGTGNNLGPWCIIGVEENHVRLTFQGAPRMLEFSVRLRYFGPDTPGSNAYVLPAGSGAASGSNIGPSSSSNLPAAPNPGALPPFNAPLPSVLQTNPAVTVAQTTPLTPALAGISTPQQAATTLTQGLGLLRQIQTSSAAVAAALVHAGTTYPALQYGISNDPMGTMTALLTAPGVTPADLTALFGPGLAAQLGQLGAVMSIAAGAPRPATTLP